MPTAAICRQAILDRDERTRRSDSAKGTRASASGAAQKAPVSPEPRTNRILAVNLMFPLL